MKFRTEYNATKAPFAFCPKRPVVLLGSCFAENMGAKMRSCLWEAENPLGTLYNPLSIASALSAALNHEEEEATFEHSLFEADGLWRSWLFDSRMAAETPADVRYAFHEAKQLLGSMLKRGEVVFVTFGTSWCYYLGGCRLVANCHKQSGALFERRRLTVNEIVAVWTALIRRLRAEYPGLKIVFTVSPVRHLKDGFEGNMRSKAILLLAVEQLCEAEADCYYFPAYEIVNDDLRDYRFYASDLTHPSDEAVDYLWEIFKKMYVNEEGLSRLKEGESIRKGLDHRPLPLATRQPSPETLAKEEARIKDLEERKLRFLTERL